MRYRSRYRYGRNNDPPIVVFFGTIFLWLFLMVRGIIRRMRKPSDVSSAPTIGQTKYSRLLWSALVNRGIDAQTEYFDGHKTVDIAILSAKLYIEVDGRQHTETMKQFISDFKRDYYSDQNGFLTFRIPNKAIWEDVNMVADMIKGVVDERQKMISQ